RPASRTEPPTTWPTFGRRFMIDRPVVDLPQPDSPTSPTHSPAPTLNETPSTAVTVAERRRNSVCRSSTSRIGDPGRRSFTAEAYGFGRDSDGGRRQPRETRGGAVARRRSSRCRDALAPR